jgi:hypothetical protein
MKKGVTVKSVEYPVLDEPRSHILCYDIEDNDANNIRNSYRNRNTVALIQGPSQKFYCCRQPIALLLLATFDQGFPQEFCLCTCEHAIFEGR